MNPEVPLHDPIGFLQGPPDSLHFQSELTSGSPFFPSLYFVPLILCALALVDGGTMFQPGAQNKETGLKCEVKEHMCSSAT